MVPSLVHLLKGGTGKVLILLGSKKGAPEDKNWSTHMSSPTTSAVSSVIGYGVGTYDVSQWEMIWI